MKKVQKIWPVILVLLNACFWIYILGEETVELYLGAEHNERMEILKEQGKYEAYIDSGGRDPELRATPVSDERLAKYTWSYCLMKTLGVVGPLFLLVYTNWLFLIPRFLAKKAYWKYFVGLLFSLLIAGCLLTLFSNVGKSTVIKSGNDIIFAFPELLGAMGAGCMALLFSTPLYLSYQWFLQQSKIINLENEQLTTELALLRSQINPHFFFNTLNNLYALTLENSQLASTVILKLSDMMRYTIYDGKEEEVAISKEVNCLENYINLQKLRAHKKISIEFEKNIKNNDLKIPPLLFLGFLENAFKHGVDTLRENAYVKLTLNVEESKVHFRIENNFDTEERHSGGGAGLENVKRRLALLYPEDKHSLLLTEQADCYIIDLRFYC